MSVNPYKMTPVTRSAPCYPQRPVQYSSVMSTPISHMQSLDDVIDFKSGVAVDEMGNITDTTYMQQPLQSFMHQNAYNPQQGFGQGFAGAQPMQPFTTPMQPVPVPAPANLQTPLGPEMSHMLQSTYAMPGAMNMASNGYSPYVPQEPEINENKPVSKHELDEAASAYMKLLERADPELAKHTKYAAIQDSTTKLKTRGNTPNPVKPLRTQKKTTRFI